MPWSNSRSSAIRAEQSRGDPFDAVVPAQPAVVGRHAARHRVAQVVEDVALESLEDRRDDLREARAFARDVPHDEVVPLGERREHPADEVGLAGPRGADDGDDERLLRRFGLQHVVEQRVLVCSARRRPAAARRRAGAPAAPAVPAGGARPGAVRPAARRRRRRRGPGRAPSMRATGRWGRWWRSRWSHLDVAARGPSERREQHALAARRPQGRGEAPAPGATARARVTGPRARAPPPRSGRGRRAEARPPPVPPTRSAARAAARPPVRRRCAAARRPPAGPLAGPHGRVAWRRAT